MGIWNDLLEEVIDVGSIPTFKGHLDRCMERTVLEGYEPNDSKGFILVSTGKLGQRMCFCAI